MPYENVAFIVDPNKRIDLRGLPTIGRGIIKPAHASKFASDGNGKTWFEASGTQERVWVIDLEKLYKIQELSSSHPHYAVTLDKTTCIKDSGYSGNIKHTVDGKECEVNTVQDMLIFNFYIDSVTKRFMCEGRFINVLSCH